MRVAVIPVIVLDVGSVVEAEERGEVARFMLTAGGYHVETVVTLALDAQGILANLLREALRRQGKK